MEEVLIEPGAEPAIVAPLVIPDLSPEARRISARKFGSRGIAARFAKGSRVHRVFTRTWTGAWNDGFIHAGNLAYTTIVALFPFFILGAAAFSAIGDGQDREASLRAFLIAVPPVVARALEPVAHDVIEARQGWLLWAGGLVGLWTVGSLIETIRDLLRRAYGTAPAQAFWRYRLLSTGIIIIAVVALLVSLIAQVALGAIEQVIVAWSPSAATLLETAALGRVIPALVLYLSLWLLFISLTPKAYRGPACPKWPGALFVTAWWIGVSVALPWVLRSMFHYDLTYGSLAGVMIALFFFWLVGLGLVIGAELNAALAESPEERDAIGRADDVARMNANKGGALSE